MKKIISMLIAAVLMTALIIPVFAHGHGNKGGSTVKYSVCAIKDCAKTGLHTHTGKTYSSHYYGDGHKYHDYCGVEDCTVDGYHEHDGAYYFAHSLNDGHDYHGYCDVENCTFTGYHEHDGAYCFPHTSNDGRVHRNAGCRLH